jgi:2,3-dihydroxyphenylpropionate 1,2-dioxygenase
VHAKRLTICLSHADPQPVKGPEPFATGSPAIHEAWVRARLVVADFDPELVVFFGTDHRRAFRDVIPTVAVALAATARGDRGGPLGDYDVPAELSRTLAEQLISRGVDVALAYRPQLDHAFGLTARDLLGGIGAYPVIPVFLNSASPPVPTLRRAAEIGRAVGDALGDRDERILFVGSGGLTHDLPGFYPLDDGIDWPEDERLRRNAELNARLRIPGLRFTPAWDRELLAGLATTDQGWLEEVGRDVATRGGNGANEAVTWVAAWAAGGEAVSVVGYEFDESHGASTGLAISASAIDHP